MDGMYHIVFYVPDLLTGTRFTLGATVETAEGYRWIEAELLPPASYLSKNQNRSGLRAQGSGLRGQGSGLRAQGDGSWGQDDRAGAGLSPYHPRS
jgi:hypothetical protein